MSDTLCLSFIILSVLVTLSAPFRSHIRTVGIRTLIAVTIVRLFFVYAARFVTYRLAYKGKFTSWLIHN